MPKEHSKKITNGNMILNAKPKVNKTPSKQTLLQSKPLTKTTIQISLKANNPSPLQLSSVAQLLSASPPNSTQSHPFWKFSKQNNQKLWLSRITHGASINIAVWKYKNSALTAPIQNPKEKDTRMKSKMKCSPKKNFKKFATDLKCAINIENTQNPTKKACDIYQ